MANQLLSEDSLELFTDISQPIIASFIGKMSEGMLTAYATRHTIVFASAIKLYEVAFQERVEIAEGYVRSRIESQRVRCLDEIYEAALRERVEIAEGYVRSRIESQRVRCLDEIYEAALRERVEIAESCERSRIRGAERDFFASPKFTLAALVMRLLAMGYKEKFIAKSAGYLSHDPKRDVGSMLEGRCFNPEWRQSLLLSLPLADHVDRLLTMGYTKQWIAQSAGYRSHDPKRDVKSMLEGRSRWAGQRCRLLLLGAA